jgi:hypothetical protein
VWDHSTFSKNRDRLLAHDIIDVDIRTSATFRYRAFRYRLDPASHRPDRPITASR